METETITALTADIVSAHVSHNTVGMADLSCLIQTVYAALANVGTPEAVVAERPEPAVSVRASLKPSAITCLECGVKMKMIKRHLFTSHGLSPADYRTRWGLSADYPMVASDYSVKRRELAIGFGLGRQPGSRRKLGSGSKPGRPKKTPATA